MSGFTENLKNFLEKIGISTLEAERRAGLKRGRLGNLLRDSNKGMVPRADCLQALEEVFGVNPTWLLTGEGEMIERDVSDEGGKKGERGVAKHGGFNNRLPPEAGGSRRMVAQLNGIGGVADRSEDVIELKEEIAMLRAQVEFWKKQALKKSGTSASETARK